MKPIIFNTDMVKAILSGRKTETRRPIKYKFLEGFNPEWTGYKPVIENGKFFLEGSNHKTATTEAKPPYQKGDILYVRETWAKVSGGIVVYKADYIEPFTGSPDIDHVGNRIRCQSGTVAGNNRRRCNGRGS